MSMQGGRPHAEPTSGLPDCLHRQSRLDNHTPTRVGGWRLVADHHAGHTGTPVNAAERDELQNARDLAGDALDGWN